MTSVVGAASVSTARIGGRARRSFGSRRDCALSAPAALTRPGIGRARGRGVMARADGAWASGCGRRRRGFAGRRGGFCARGLVLEPLAQSALRALDALPRGALSWIRRARLVVLPERRAHLAEPRLGAGNLLDERLRQRDVVGLRQRHLDLVLRLAHG